MHLRQLPGALRCIEAIDIDGFRTLGRVDLEVSATLRKSWTEP